MIAQQLARCATGFAGTLADDGDPDPSPTWLRCDYAEFSPSPADLSAPRVWLSRPWARHVFDAGAASRAAASAAAAGLAPPVCLIDESNGAIVWQPWSARRATLADLADPATLSTLVDAKRAVAALPLRRRCCIFDQIAALGSRAREVGALLPPATADLTGHVELLRPFAEQPQNPLRACHGDGTASTVLLHGGQVRFASWARAGLMDPLQDIGALIAEIGPDQDAARIAFERYCGGWCDVDFARAVVFAAADELRWLLTAAIAGAAWPAIGGFALLAAWRAWRCETTLGWAASLAGWPAAQVSAP